MSGGREEKSTVDSTEKNEARFRWQATLNAIVGHGLWGIEVRGSHRKDYTSHVPTGVRLAT